MIQLLNKLKNFRSIYYIIYVVFTFMLFYLAYDLVDVLDTLKRWGWYKYFSELPSLGSKFIYFIAFVMLFELVFENFLRVKNSRKVASLEKEITNLKAKLYDQGQIADVQPETTEERTIEEPEQNDDALDGDILDDNK
jgi:hypothetical protein